MAADAVDLGVRISLRNDVGLGLMAVLAGLADRRLRVVRLPVVARHFMRIVAGNAAHALFVVLGHHELRTFRTAGGARGLRLHVKARFDLLHAVLVGGDHIRHEVGTLVATFAVRFHAVAHSARQVAAGTVAFFAGNAAGNGVLLQFLRITQSREEFLLVLEVELERMADFAVGRGRLEEELLFVRSTVARHTPFMGAGTAEALHIGREVRNDLLDFLGAFRGEPLGPAAGELVAAGNDRTGTVLQKTVTHVVGTAGKPPVDVAVLRTRGTQRRIDHVGRDAVGQNRSLRTVELLFEIVVDFRMFAGETYGLRVAGTLPLLVLNRVALAALFRAHELRGEVEDGGLRQAVLRSLRTVGAGGLRIALGVAFAQVFRTTARNLVHTDDTAFGRILKDRMVLEHPVPEFLFLNDVIFQRTHTVLRGGEIGVIPNRLRRRIHVGVAVAGSRFGFIGSVST